MTSKTRLRADKGRAILAGALTVFARDGYTRASIDAIATAAEVSTRTIYNHFADKAELFRTVIQDSAGNAAAAQLAIIERHFHKITDLEVDLIDFGRELAAPMTEEHAEHFALVQQVNAERRHIPPDAIEAWQETGPRRVRRELADRLSLLADRGLLRVDDADLAALHLMTLISIAAPQDEPADVTRIVTAGIRTFLYGLATAENH